MTYFKNILLLLCLTIIAGCSQSNSEYNLDELKGPAAILIETWRADGISDKDILKRIDNHMNADGTELYFDEESKKVIERVQNYTVEGTQHSLKEFMGSLNENIAWVDSGFITADDFINQAEYPIYFSEDARLVGVSENSRNPEFKVLLYVDDEVISVYKIKSNESEAFNKEAELALNLIYENLMNPNTVKNEKEDEDSIPIEEGALPEKSNLDVVPVEGAENTVESAREQIGYLMMNYIQTYVDGDTMSLDYYVHPSSTFYSEQEGYMESLNSRSIVLDLIDYHLNSIEQVSEKKYEVSVTEYYTIDNPEKGLSDTEQTSKYIVELLDGEFYITGLEL